MNLSLRHFMLVGGSLGCVVALANAFALSDAEIRFGATRLAVGLWTALFFVPVGIACLCLVRFSRQNVGKPSLVGVVWPLGAAWFSIGLTVAACSEWNSVQRFEREGEETVGQILESQPHNHNSLVVRYEVDGTSYQRLVSAPHEADEDALRPTVTVYYYDSAPEAGVCRKPEWRPGELFIGWILSAGAGCFLLARVGDSLVALKRETNVSGLSS